MIAKILSGEEGIEKSVDLLSRGEVVGVPTETVYGLAGDAFQLLAAVRIFEAKGRPLNDPLIVHLPEVGWLHRVAEFDSPEQYRCIEQLASAFWPGPLTLILRRKSDISDLVTAGMDTVAVRVTAHPIFQAVLRRLNSPLAAPSANRFGRISPTTAQDVQIELGNMIPMILDGGSCQHGMESTIVAVKGDELHILRPGPITQEQLIEFGHVVVPNQIVNTPGSLLGHYAPKKKLEIIKSDITSFIPMLGSGLLAWTTPSSEVARRYAAVEILSPNGDLREAAVNFYAALRRLDNSKSNILFSEPLPEEGIGVAVMDRMRRASHGSINT